MANEQVAQLMHLGALAFAVSAGYVGLDKIRHEDDDFRKELAQTCAATKKDVVILDLENAEWETQRLYLIHPVFVLVMVAELPIELPRWARWYHCAKRQPRLPLLDFIRKGRDIRVMAVLCLLDLAALIAVAAVGMWPDHAAGVLSWPAAWVPATVAAACLVVWSYYGFREGFKRTKALLKFVGALAVVATGYALLWPGQAMRVANLSEPHVGDALFFLFVGTLLFAVFTTACSNRLRDAHSVFNDYRARMQNHLDNMANQAVKRVETSLRAELTK